VYVRTKADDEEDIHINDDAGEVGLFFGFESAAILPPPSPLLGVSNAISAPRKLKTLPAAVAYLLQAKICTGQTYDIPWCGILLRILTYTSCWTISYAVVIVVAESCIISCERSLPR
jgi:hypothetical protein